MLDLPHSKRDIGVRPTPCIVLVCRVYRREIGFELCDFYQFCNGIQLNRVLPPGPRDYWNELAAEHKTAPEHMKWMYDPDPFAARLLVNERQAKAARKREETSQGPSDPARNTSVSNQFSHVPEVKMASGLRELVDDAIKKVSCQRLTL
jgi:ATP-dependent RNA helicase DHX57